jgi:Outer membrane lipoprotein carrier protein LolA-like
MAGSRLSSIDFAASYWRDRESVTSACMDTCHGSELVEASQGLTQRNTEKTLRSRSSKDFEVSCLSLLKHRAKRYTILSVKLSLVSPLLRVKTLAYLLTAHERPRTVDSVKSRRQKVRLIHAIVIAGLTYPMAVIATAPALAQRPAATSEWNLTTLMNTMHQVRRSSAGFVETKYLHLLNQAQRSSGRLTYAAPDQLTKETYEPIASRMTVIGDRLTMERQGEKPRDISLRDYSEVGALIEGVRATLAGDLPTLTRHFTAVVDGDANRWTLSLAPLEPRLRELVTAIHIKGERNSIRDIETIEADGDRTDTAISPDLK